MQQYFLSIVSMSHDVHRAWQKMFYSLQRFHPTFFELITVYELIFIMPKYHILKRNIHNARNKLKDCLSVLVNLSCVLSSEKVKATLVSSSRSNSASPMYFRASIPNSRHTNCKCPQFLSIFLGYKSKNH